MEIIKIIDSITIVLLIGLLCRYAFLLYNRKAEQNVYKVNIINNSITTVNVVINVIVVLVILISIYENQILISVLGILYLTMRSYIMNISSLLLNKRILYRPNKSKDKLKIIKIINIIILSLIIFLKIGV